MGREYKGVILDGDGHIFEDRAAIKGRMPQAWHDARAMGRIGPIQELDNYHGLLSISPEGAFTDPGGVSGWSKFMDDLRISGAVLYPTDALSVGRMVDLDQTIAFTRAYNDWMHDTYMVHDARLQGVALLPMQEPDEAVKELRRVVEELGMHGAMLPATGLKANLGAKEYWPIYAEADRLGCYLSVHGGAYPNLGFNDLNIFAAIHAMGHPFGITIAFTSMLFNGIFDKFPNVRYGFMEGGVGWLLMAMERSDGSYKAFRPLDPRNEYIQLSNGESVYEYIARNIKEGRIYVGVEGEEPELAYAAHAIGNEAFVWSSDFPHEVNTESCAAEIQEMVDNEALTDDDLDAILHRNAARLYGFNNPEVTA
jgi:predicted TIM-barrel fold metal-dependent hydrolase